MGKDPNEVATQGKKSKSKSTKPPGMSSFTTYHPKPEHKPSIQEIARDTARTLDYLYEIAAKGVEVKIKFRDDFGAFAATARKGEGDWRSIPTVAAYHAAADRALASLLFYLVDLYPDWPAEGPTSVQLDLDW